MRGDDGSGGRATLSRSGTTYSLAWDSDTKVSDATFAVQINGQWVFGEAFPNHEWSEANGWQSLHCSGLAPIESFELSIETVEGRPFAVIKASLAAASEFELGECYDAVRIGNDINHPGVRSTEEPYANITYGKTTGSIDEVLEGRDYKGMIRFARSVATASNRYRKSGSSYTAINHCLTCGAIISRPYRLISFPVQIFLASGNWNWMIALCSAFSTGLTTRARRPGLGTIWNWSKTPIA